MKGVALAVQALPGGQAVAIRPAPLPAAWLGAVLLLAALFGLPALAILLSPARWDGLSLASMALGLGIAAWALGAAWRARRLRRPQRLVLGPERIEAGARSLRWDEVTGFEVLAPRALAQGPAAAGGVAMGLRIGAARAAQDWRVAAGLAAGGRQVLATGLDEAAAGRLHALLEGARPAARGAD